MMNDQSTQRIRPLPTEEWSPEVRELLGGTHESVAQLSGDEGDSNPPTLNILRTIAHHPTVLGPFLGFASALAQQGTLSRRDSELLALRAAWNCRSDFEWGHHVAFARVAGLGDDEIARIAKGPDAPEWSESDRTLLRAADQLHAQQQIEDDVWRLLASEHSEAQLVEIPFIVGQYTMLSMVANATGVELEEEYEPLPEAPSPPVPSSPVK
ncbi:MAG: carboxymuconolactone decarboxylase family protein [Deltaproteobacteria bacterium]|nr:carboxymuconolactone decarboxylase family protein [Deltaproteobacteria bacterium]